MSTKERTTKIAEMQVRYARERAEEQAVLDAAPEPPHVKRERAISGAQGMTETADQRIGARMLRLEREMPQSEVALLQGILRQLVELNCSLYEMRMTRGE